MPETPPALPRSAWSPLMRVHALLVGALIFAGVAAAGATARPVSPLQVGAPAAFAARLAPAVPARSTAARLTAPKVRAGRAGSAAAPAAANPHPGARYLPTGTGMWTHQWDKTEGGDADAIVRRATRTGLSHLFVRTGTRKGGFDGGPILDELLPATRGTGIKVIAWDFPYLVNPEADARRLARAARYVPPGEGTPRVAAVAPDIETGAEGTRLSGAAVRIYYRELRRLLPDHIAILATVPWPSEKRVGRYPYAESALYADAFIPMAYWINRDPQTVTRQSMLFLRRFGKPIMPAGQAYDPRIDRPELKLRSPSAKAIAHFIRAAKDLGAPSVSLWVWQTADDNHWTAIGRARHLFKPVRPGVVKIKVPKPVLPDVPPATKGHGRTGRDRPDVEVDRPKRR
ncbi:MAG TPA: hypothetical protein VNB94_08850 [Mycobacteriales bacterium]|nr:hypothetical protein [Mycobacteriales bacterium]